MIITIIIIVITIEIIIIIVIIIIIINLIIIIIIIIIIIMIIMKIILHYYKEKGGRTHIHTQPSKPHTILSTFFIFASTSYIMVQVQSKVIWCLYIAGRRGKI